MGTLLMAAGATVCWALWAFLAKTNSLGWREQTFWAQTAQGAVAIGLLFGGLPRATGKPAFVALLTGGFAAAGMLLFYAALRDGRSALVVPLTSLYPAIAVALSALLLGEPVGARQVIGIVLACGAALLLVRD